MPDFPRIDFTRKRLGSRTSGSRRIEKCPTCGRKGEMVRLTSTPIWTCTHVADDWGWATAAFDSCTGRIVDGKCVPGAKKPT